MLLLDVSLMMSYTRYATPADQLPRYVPTALLVLGLPLPSNDRNLFALTVLTGSVILTEVGSVTGAFRDLSAVSATCCTKIVWESISLLTVPAKKSPPVVKSVVRSIALEPVIVILSEPVAANTKVIDPVPRVGLIVTV